MEAVNTVGRYLHGVVLTAPRNPIHKQNSDPWAPELPSAGPLADQQQMCRDRRVNPAWQRVRCLAKGKRRERRKRRRKRDRALKKAQTAGRRERGLCRAAGLHLQGSQRRLAEVRWLVSHQRSKHFVDVTFT